MEKLSLSSTPPWHETKEKSLSQQISAGVHFFILADIIVFFGIFIDFMQERSQDLDTFNQSAALLDPWSGIINTLILITSGFFVVISFNCARAGKIAEMRRWMLAAIIVGSGFALSKGIEYSGKLADGLTMHTNEFFMFYYTLTGAHFLHFIGGMIALATIYNKAKNEAVDEEFLGNFESVALYWHMVDFLWISIFPLLYLLGA